MKVERKRATGKVAYTLEGLMGELESLGTEQNRKNLPKHGAPADKLFGVPWAHLTRLQKAIKRDHKLALELWNTGNSDAQCLAAMIADPTVIDEATLERWLGETTWKVPGDTIARHVASKTPFALTAALKWTLSRHEWTSECGWTVVGLLAATPVDKGGQPDATFSPLLERIEAEIHTAPNQTRMAMLMALIGFGGYRAGLREKALAAAGRIGKVKIDHGDTNCKTPNPVEYIGKMAAREKGGVES